MKKILFAVVFLGMVACYGKTKSQVEYTEVANSDSVEYSQNLSWNDYQFNVVVQGDSLYIETKGKEIPTQTVQRDMMGYTVIGSEVGDLNIDGRPEVMVYLSSDGSGSYGCLMGYSITKDAQLLALELPDLSLDKKNSKGYMGHDEFAIVENTFCRRFPVYKDGDTNANPTGGTRQIQYKLPKTDGAYTLAVDRVVEY